MNIEKFIHTQAVLAIESLYGPVDPSLVQVSKTRRECEGDCTLVVFPRLKLSRKGPEQTAKEIGERMVADNEVLGSFNVIKGFLNLSFTDSFWMDKFVHIASDPGYGTEKPTERTTMVEY